jgi:histidinol-phosphate aminotransferase
MGFVIQPEYIYKKIQEREYRLVFICNPNNPTGKILPLNVLDEWAREFPSTLFVVDEAYLAFAPGMVSAITLHRKNILVLRSMTKDYAIAGLRLGYAVGTEVVIDALANLRPAWNVNSLAQAAGLAALQDESHLTDTLAKLRQEYQTLIDDLKALGFDPVPSQTHYFLLPVENGAQYRSKLLQQRILIRDCASFGLPDYVRIATRQSEENVRLISAIKEIQP